MTGIADTGFVVAFLNRRDAFHAWALRVAEQVDEPLVTCEAVLAEATFHTGSATKVLALVRFGMLTTISAMRRSFSRMDAASSLCPAAEQRR